VLKDEAVNKRIFDAFMEKAPTPGSLMARAERFLGNYSTDEWTQVRDILDVWFDSGSTHAFCWNSATTSNGRPMSISKAPTSTAAGSIPRCWKAAARVAARPMTRSSPTASPWPRTAARCPSRSATRCLPQDVMKQSGADILRLWVMSVDYWEDQRIGPTVLKTNVDAYRKLRNTIRWMLGTLAHDKNESVEDADMPELERLMLHTFPSSMRGAQGL
jgi:isoleucyl-tRNA synthetase